MDVAALVDDLRSLGVHAGDVLMVHASLRAHGPVDGGAAGVIDALDHAVGATGTLLMTLGTHDPWAWVNERPEAQRAELLNGFGARTARRGRRQGAAPRRRSGHGIVDHPGEDYFATILHSYVATGRARTGTVGNARSELIDAADFVEFAAEWMGCHLS